MLYWIWIVLASQPIQFGNIFKCDLVKISSEPHATSTENAPKHTNQSTNSEWYAYRLNGLKRTTKNAFILCVCVHFPFHIDIKKYSFIRFGLFPRISHFENVTKLP